MLPLWKRISAGLWSSGGVRAAWCLFAIGLAAIVVTARKDPIVVVSTCRATASVVEDAAEPPFCVTCFDDDPSRASQAADTLASQYAAARGAEWRRHADAKYAAAHARTERARHDEDQTTVRWLAAQQQAHEDEQPSGAGAGSPPESEYSHDAAPRPALIENPRWSALHQELTKLEQSREELLIRYTPLHPAVVLIDERIEGAKTALNATPPKILGPTVRGPSDAAREESTARMNLLRQARAAQSQEKLAKLSAVLDAAHRARQGAEYTEQQIAQQRDAGPQLAIGPARAVRIAWQTTEGGRPLVAWTMLLAGSMMVVGVGLVSVGRSIEPPVASLREIELDLGVDRGVDLGETPIHAVETDDPAPDFAGLRRQQVLRHAATVVGWCLLIVFSSSTVLPALRF